MAKKDPLMDRDFLRRLDQENQKEIFVKIATLTFDEDPIEFITGRATGGSINIDGQSSTRRTCSISLVAKELNIHDFYWGLNTKIEVFIGVKNKINSDYPEIIWFPQGIYLITDFSTNQTTNNYTISITGRDKMSLLNGDIGGIITSLTADFGKIEEIDDNGNSIISSLPLKDVIREVVHEDAREPVKNIIIEDLDDVWLELLEYKDNTAPMYLLRRTLDGEVQNIFSSNMEFYVSQSKDGPFGSQKWSVEDEEFHFDSRTDFLDNSETPTYVKADLDPNSQVYTVIKYEYGDAVGYRETDLTYPGDLIGNVGSSIVQSCLDPIKNMLGNFEYFYDLEGKFHFRRKKTFIDISWNNLINPGDSKEMYSESTALTSPFSYSFEDANLITSFQNKPKLSNLKNDFSIWGTKKTSGGNEYPVHLRYAIDKKPTYYKNYNGEVYSTENKTISQLETEAKKALIGTLEEIVNKHKATKRQPRGLDEDWWELGDWLALYRELLGDKAAMPSQRVRDYLDSNVYQTPDLKTLFPNDNSRYPGVNVPYDRTPIYCFDTYRNEDGTDGPLAYVAHAIGCSHSLSQFLEENYRNHFYTYLYKPKIPSSIQTEIDDTQIRKYIKKLHYSCDWREIIYQMAKDYLRYEHTHDFLATIAENNIDYYPTGQTGYEMYYTDIISFWRELYNPDYKYTARTAYVTKSSYEENPSQYYWYNKATIYEENKIYYTKNVYGEFDQIQITEQEFDNNPGKYWSLKQGYAGEAFDPNRDYFTLTEGDYQTIKYTSEKMKNWAELDEKAELNPKLKNEGIVYYIESQKIYCTWSNEENKFVTLSEYNEKLQNNPNFGWNMNIIENPSGINFWFDFLDAKDGSLTAYNVRNIGDRPKSVNDSNVKAIYYRDIPNVIFLEEDLSQEERNKQKLLKPGYTFVNLPNIRGYQFTLSSQKKSAKDVLEEWLYQYTTCTDSITISSLPVYYLEPNTRIFIHDNNSGINGEYIVDKISYQLTYNSTMSIQATKAIDRIY